jgi:hypothetical protein
MFIDLMGKGKTVEQAALEVFAPPPQENPPPGASTPGDATAGPESALGGGPAGMPPGAQPGVMPGAQAEAGGRPPLQEFLAGLRSNGQPNLQAAVSRQNPVGP